MCGRYVITSPLVAVAQLFDAVPDDVRPLGPRVNISPAQSVPVVIAREGVRLVVLMCWRFIRIWGKTATVGPLMINARAETIADTPM